MTATPAIGVVTVTGVLLFGQAMVVRRRVPRLPDAMGPRSGVVPGPLPVLRVEVVGESSVSGVGIERLDKSLAPMLATRLAQNCDRSVAWRAHGWSGARIEGACQRLLPRVHRDIDLLVVVIGVNDTIRLTPLDRWEAGVRRFLQCATEQIGDVPIAWVGIPKLEDFPIMPQPLRRLSGLRAAAVERRTRRALEHFPNASFVPTPAGDPTMVGADGFHPNEEGYRQWAVTIADSIARDGQQW